VSERQYPSDIIRVGATRTPLFDFRPSRFPLLLFWFSFFYPSVPHAAIKDENAKIFPKYFFSLGVNYAYHIGRRSESGRSSPVISSRLKINFSFPLIFHFPLHTIHHTSSNLSLPLLSRASNRMSDGQGCCPNLATFTHV
jgi:hypothetical protein